MTLNSLSPAYVQVDYHTAYAPHKMTLPTLTWTNGVGYAPGYFATHNAGVAFADVMVEAFVDVLLPLYDNTFVVDAYTIYNKPLPADFPQPVFSKRLAGKIGTGTPTGWNEAVQKTYFMRTSLFNPSKIVLLDVFTNNNFGKYYAVSSDEQDMLDIWMDLDNGWAGRDGAAPTTFKALTITLNKRLRREYHII